MSDNNVLNNKYFQEYMIVSTKEWNRIQTKENEKEKQEGRGDGDLDEDLARVNHSARSALIYKVQQLRQIEKIIQAILDGKLRHQELPEGISLSGLLARKQKLLNRYGNMIMSMGVPPATYFHTRKMQQLQEKQLEAARVNTQANRETLNIQNSILDEQRKNNAKLKELLSESEKKIEPPAFNLYEDSDEEIELKDGLPREKETDDDDKEMKSFMSKMWSYVTPSKSATKSPKKMPTVRFDADDGKVHVQPPKAPQKQTRGTHAMKTRSQNKPSQDGNGCFEKRAMKKPKLYEYLPEDSEGHLTRPFYKTKWLNTK